jgi:hypothetical protein
MNYLVTMRRKDTIALIRVLTAITRTHALTDTFICKAVSATERKPSRVKMNFTMSTSNKTPRKRT